MTIKRIPTFLFIALPFLISSCGKSSGNKPNNNNNNTGTTTDTTVTTTPNTTGKYLLFDADQDFNTGKTNSPSVVTGVFYAKIDGTVVTRLTTPPDGYTDYRATASADGKHVLFLRVSVADTERNVYTIDLTGSNLKLVTNGIVDCPTFSPDGTKVAYERSESSVAPEHNDIYVANIDGTNETKITDLASKNGGAGNIRWSKNGKIYFTAADKDNAINIYSINPDGSNIISLNLPQSYLQDVSPDGTQVLFDTKTGLFICNGDGSNTKTIVTLTAATNGILGASFSADGKEIFYSNTYSVSAEGIFKVNIDGSNNAKVVTGYYEYPSVLQ